jgi:hypothetical protein
MPDITLRQLHEFMRAVDEGTWVGDGSVWIAADEADATPHAFPCPGDPMRAIPLPPVRIAATHAGDTVRLRRKRGA